MKREIREYKHYFSDFKETISDDVKKKFAYVFLLLKTLDRVPTKFVKHIEDGIFELRVEWEGNIYRAFFIFDEGSIVMLFNGFQKKTQKTPKSEIEKAKQIKEEYFNEKKK